MLMKNSGPCAPQKIAVLGSGIAGMSAAWLLSHHHQVSVYEKNAKAGGHSNTVEIDLRGARVPVDTGFIVFNDRNYPNLEALFDHLGVPISNSNMSFAASIRDGELEYAGSKDLTGILGQRRNALRPRYWRMINDILRFYRQAPKLLRDRSAQQLSLGEYLSDNRYSQTFIHDHLLPMGAAIWSTKSADILKYPVVAFVRFCDSHGLLSLTGRPQWKSVIGGSREYVKRLTAPYAETIVLNADIAGIQRHEDGVTICHRDGRHDRFDHVVIATHADEAYALLDDKSPAEQEILGAFGYTPNRAVLHTDATLMPKRRRVWSSWNYMHSRTSDQDAALCVSYWMNSLQQLGTDEDVFVTLNPMHEPDPGKVAATFDYSHPLFDTAALKAQSRLWEIQGAQRTWFCGSYFGHGFHEDALQAGLAAAEAVGPVQRPWTVDAESGRIWDAITPKVAAE